MDLLLSSMVIMVFFLFFSGKILLTGLNSPLFLQIMPSMNRSAVFVGYWILPSVFFDLFWFYDPFSSDLTTKRNTSIGFIYGFDWRECSIIDSIDSIQLAWWST
jgi:hypothetical protein